jgi:hypothetical protein
MPTVDINIWAVLACAVASMVVGFLWYGPLFSKAWMRSVGINPDNTEQMKKMQSEATPGYIAMFLGSFVMAYVLAHVLATYNTQTIGMGLQGAFWMWLGFVATVGLGAKFFEKKPWSYYFINQGYELVKLLVFSIILVSWK